MKCGVGQYFFFYHATTNRILNTPLFDLVLSDALTWKFEKDGTYTVRSAYPHIMNANINMLQHRVARHFNII